MESIQIKINRRCLKLACYLIRKTQKPIWPDKSKGYLTIFFDYEGDYALPDPKRALVSVYGVKRILEICKKHDIKATFNTVGRLFYDHPEIIQQIIEDGHDVASHSFKHDIISRLSRDEIYKDIQKTNKVFEEFGLVLGGMRSPQSRWSFKQMAAMLNNGLNWSAEGDPARHPYIIYKKDGKSLVRFPVTFDDYYYISGKFTTDQMYGALLETANKIQDAKIFGAIGFHPWINGEDESRLRIMEIFFRDISQYSGLKIITFNEAYNLVSEHNHELKRQ